MGFLYLVGGLNPSEKYESQVSWDDYSDNIYIYIYIYYTYIYIYIIHIYIYIMKKNKTCSKPPTRIHLGSTLAMCLWQESGIIHRSRGIRPGMSRQVTHGHSPGIP